MPAAGGNFEDFEVEIMKIVLENGKFSPAALFFSEFCIFHQFDWKIRAEGAKFFEMEILSWIWGQAGNFS